MKRVVLKFGGYAMRDQVNRRRAATMVVDYLNRGVEVAVVVSAVQGYTNWAEEQWRQEGGRVVRNRDKMLLAGELYAAGLMAETINSVSGFGTPAVALDGRQAGIRDGGVVGGPPEGIAIPVVAGFQYYDPEIDDLVAMGRGGSDLTAVMLGAAWGGQVVLLKEEPGVWGVFPPDEGDKPLEHLSYEDALLLPSSPVMPEALEYARERGVVVVVRGLWSSGAGTVISN